MKLRFFTNISHELRTPLTLITAPLNNFFEKDVTPSPKVLQIMYKNSQRLLELINQILDFRKFENKQELKLSEQKTFTLFENIHNAYVYWAKEKQITFQKNIQNTLNTTVLFDADIVQKITSNLISNAIKYTPEHGKVSLIVYLKQENKTQNKALLQIEIKDNGLGIPEEYQQKIFERYFQLDEDAQKINSSGIGLSLCAELVALHGGQILLQSKPNHGSHFTVTLPVTTATGNTQETPLHLSNETIENSETEKDVLLLVEDNLDIRDYLYTELEQEYTVLTASNGKEGLAAAVAKIPNIIISDIMMPVVDGIQFAKQLKSNDLTSHIPILFLTAKTGIDNKLIGLNSGGHDYIQKPFHISEIQLKLKNILNSQQKFVSKNQQKTATISVNERQDNFLSNINNYLDDYLDNTNLGVELFCDTYNINRSQLHRKIQSITGKSTIEYVNFYKISKAMELLKKGEFSVKEIAYSVGFDDSRYFSRVFKNKFGNPPSFYIPKK